MQQFDVNKQFVHHAHSCPMLKSKRSDVGDLPCVWWKWLPPNMLTSRPSVRHSASSKHRASSKHSHQNHIRTFAIGCRGFFGYTVCSTHTLAGLPFALRLNWEMSRLLSPLILGRLQSHTNTILFWFSSAAAAAALLIALIRQPIWTGWRVDWLIESVYWARSPLTNRV